MRLGTIYRYDLLNYLDLFSRIDETHSVLDIGGFDGYLLSKLNSKSKTLIDININKKFKNIDYLRGDFLNYNLPKEKFDFVFSFDVLEHLPEGTEKEFFVRVEKTLKPKGIFLITVPSKDIKLFPNILTNYVSGKWDHSKCMGYSKKELRGFIKSKNIKYEIIDLNARFYLNTYLLIRSLQPILPKRIIERVIDKAADYDSRHNRGINGYFLIRGVKN